MAEYIEREALLAEMRVSSKAAYLVVMDAPAADVAPVVRAKWEFSHTTSDGFAVVKCSNCGHEAFAMAIYVKEGHFCPNCGAKMEG